jgi:hypothetical protein
VWCNAGMGGPPKSGGPDWATNRGQHLAVFIARPRGWGGIGRGWKAIFRMIQVDDDGMKSIGLVSGTLRLLRCRSGSGGNLKAA